jgi:hypothetical protein
MIHSRLVRTLQLGAPSERARPCHVAAASGLVVVGEHLFVVADDELHLGCFPACGRGDGHTVRLFAGELPLAHDARKAGKPDLEALLHLPPFGDASCGALLALPSGSTAQRRRAALLPLDIDGAVVGDARTIDVAGLYAGLDHLLPALNIEGAVVSGDSLVLLHRGSRAYPLNALVHLSLQDMLDSLVAHAAIDAMEPRAVQRVDLGMIDGVALSFTDGAALSDGRLVVTAVAERSPDTWLDGPCIGAAIGVLGNDGCVQQLHRLQPTEKIEGVHAWIEGDTIRLLLATDADDADVASRLLSAEMRAADAAPP